MVEWGVFEWTLTTTIAVFGSLVGSLLWILVRMLKWGVEKILEWLTATHGELTTWVRNLEQSTSHKIDNLAESVINLREEVRVNAERTASAIERKEKLDAAISLLQRQVHQLELQMAATLRRHRRENHVNEEE